MDELDFKGLKGLSDEAVAARLKEEGYNELPAAKKRSVFAIAFEVVREPMFLLLIGCGAIYLVLGDVQEASMLLGFVLVVMGITLYQERRTERALEALRDLSSPRALVIRGGELKRIPGREVVREDILVLSEGDRVPADAVVISCLNFSTDESILTGESVPVRKVACLGTIATTCPGGDDLPFVFAGSLVVQGRGIACVRATGVHTEMGRIGKRLQTIEPESTPLQAETRRLVRHVAVLGLLLCSAAILAYGLTRGRWLDGILAGITLAMAILPEEYPMVLTIFLALGAWRIAKKQVLTRRIAAVETLGAATVLCVDKTGTLTENRMAVTAVFSEGALLRLDEHSNELLSRGAREVLILAALASQKEPFDPMEKAIRTAADRCCQDGFTGFEDWRLMREYPLTPTLLSFSRAWRHPGGQTVAAKGAPEAIAELCRLTPSDAGVLMAKVHSMAGEGLRVLGVAEARFEGETLPDDQRDLAFRFVGLLGLADPVRRAVPAAVKECYGAGIRVVMITGDYPETALSIGRQIGLDAGSGCMTGQQLSAMDDTELQDLIGSINIFARVVPEQKLRLVNALKANGEVVAMTGDGVNDAPALKSAHIGIAMGGRGSDVARESSSLVLLDDDFSSIVQAVKMGRRIFDNLKKAMAYILAIHVPIAGVSLLPIFFKWPLILFPAHVAFLELIIDPACSVIFEAEREEEDIMRRTPRDPKAPLFSKKMIALSLLQGLSVLAIVVAVFILALLRGHGAEDARTLTFTSLIVANLGLILTNRSWSHTIPEILRKPNPALWWVIGGALVFLGVVLYVPFFRSLFHFSRLHPNDLALCLGAGVASVLWFEGLKAVRRKRMRN